MAYRKTEKKNAYANQSGKGKSWALKPLVAEMCVRAVSNTVLICWQGPSIVFVFVVFGNWF